MQFDNSSRHCFMMLPMLLPCSSDTAAAEVAPKVEDATAALEAGADAPKPAAEELAATSAPPEALGAGVPNRDGVAAAELEPALDAAPNREAEEASPNKNELLLAAALAAGCEVGTAADVLLADAPKSPPAA